LKKALLSKEETMEEERFEWEISGEGTEACTSPPVCPAYWGSPLPKDLHDGKSQGESVYSFSIKEGYYQDVALGGLKVCLPFNVSPGFPEVKGGWPALLFIDSNADDEQAKALEEIYRKGWMTRGEILKVKKGEISFTKELVNGGPAARFEVEISGVYRLKTQPLLTKDGRPRYINTARGGIVNIGASEVNEFKDKDLPRTWNRSGMTVTYWDFVLNPQRLYWMP
jgi:hypothetical protein